MTVCYDQPSWKLSPQKVLHFKKTTFSTTLKALCHEMFQRLLGILSLAAVCSCLGINKCCLDNQEYNDEFNCVRVESNVSENYWLSDNLNRSLPDLSVSFGAKCDLAHAKMVLSDFYKLMDDGNLSLLNNDGFHVATYSQQSYCLERVGGSFDLNVAYLCPCIEHVCIFKCCSSDEHIRNTISKTGQVRNYCDATNKTDWNPNVLNGTKIKNYHEILFEAHDCTSRNQESLHITGFFELLNNGSIRSEMNGILDPLEYCGDYVEDDKGTRVSKVVACLNKYTVPLESKVYAGLTLIGAFFLLVTSIIHFWMPRISLGPVWAFPIHTSSLLMAYLVLVYQQLSPSLFGNFFCIASGS